MIEEKYGIPRRRLTGLMSPWCYKRLEASSAATSRNSVCGSPSRLRQIAIAKTEPGDENNQDISSLVGKVDIRKLETFARTIPTPTAIPAASTAPTRACSNSSRCSRRRSRCCIRC
jgi:serine protein kinase